ncbi:hypothetical protein B4O97_19180, partial [Marispirochaeta aestuarii]
PAAEPGKLRLFAICLRSLSRSAFKSIPVPHSGRYRQISEGLKPLPVFTRTRKKPYTADSHGFKNGSCRPGFARIFYFPAAPDHKTSGFVASHFIEDEVVGRAFRGSAIAPASSPATIF